MNVASLHAKSALALKAGGLGTHNKTTDSLLP